MGTMLREGWMILAALLPSIGLVYLFYVIMKHMVEGDRRERAALREFDAAQKGDKPTTSADAAQATPRTGSEPDAENTADSAP